VPPGGQTEDRMKTIIDEGDKLGTDLHYRADIADIGVIIINVVVSVVFLHVL